MKPGGNLDQSTDAASHLGASSGRFQNLRQQLKDRRLSGSVRSDDSERFSRLNIERHILKRPKFLSLQLITASTIDCAAHERRHEVSKAVVALAPAKLLPDAVENHC